MGRSTAAVPHPASANRTVIATAAERLGKNRLRASVIVGRGRERPRAQRAKTSLGRIDGTAGPMDMPDGHKWALLADPEGHVVGLYGTG